ncbi:MAG: DUF2807 domain-containing protein [Chitinophagaceae bacterium]|nr:DUF2807 domain-containing protein [Chitinophagaceae bacterium]
MKQLISFSLAALILISFSSCEKVIGDGPIVSETRVVREFTELEFGVPGELEFIQSEDREVTIEAQRNIADVIQTYVTGNELRIKVKDSKTIRTSEPIRIVVKAPGVHSFSVSGPGAMAVNNIQYDGISRLKLSGSGKIIVQKLQSTNLEARISGSGSIEVMEGNVDHEDIDISGSGDVNLVEVAAKKASTQTSGSGNIRLNVSDELDVRISGSGDVFYKGSPVVNVSVSGSGRLIKL